MIVKTLSDDVPQIYCSYCMFGFRSSQNKRPFHTQVTVQCLLVYLRGLTFHLNIVDIILVISVAGF